MCNPVNQSGVTVTAAIATGGGTLGGTLTAATNGSGVASFTDLAISGTAGDRTLDRKSVGQGKGADGTGRSTAVNATQLSITTQPSSSAQRGVGLDKKRVVQLR